MISSSGTRFLIGAAGGALAGRMVSRKHHHLVPMLVGGAAGSFVMTSLPGSSAQPAAGLRYAGAAGATTPGAAKEIGWGAILLLGGIGYLVFKGDKALKKLGG